MVHRAFTSPLVSITFAKSLKKKMHNQSGYDNSVTAPPSLRAYPQRSGKECNLKLNSQYLHRRHQRKIPMKYPVSRLMSFDSESMSDCTPHLAGIRVAERIPQDSTRWFSTQHFRQLKASVENVVSGHGSGNLWTLVGANPEPVGVVNPISAPLNSTSTCTSSFTGRVSIL